MPEKLYVHADLGDGTIVLAGQLIVDDKLGRFKYSKAYINNPRAFALNPINLPLNDTGNPSTGSQVASRKPTSPKSERDQVFMTAAV